MVTCLQRIEVFSHVMTNILGYHDGSSMMKAIQQLKYACINDIETMSKDEIMTLICDK
jgi:hypothetical protein